MIVNAAGPFLDGLNASWNLRRDIRLCTQGVHLVVDQLTPNGGFSLFGMMSTSFYVIPMGNRSVIGTTDMSRSPYIG